MDPERLGRVNLAAQLLDTHAELLGGRSSVRVRGLGPVLIPVCGPGPAGVAPGRGRGRSACHDGSSAPVAGVVAGTIVGSTLEVVMTRLAELPPIAQPSSEVRVRQRMRCMSSLVRHAGVFVSVNAVLGIVDLTVGPSGLQWAYWITALWGALLPSTSWHPRWMTTRLTGSESPTTSVVAGTTASGRADTGADPGADPGRGPDQAGTFAEADRAAGVGGVGGCGATGSLPPWSRRNGGYSSVISAT